jgi:Tfp pilus assembly protein PilX
MRKHNLCNKERGVALLIALLALLLISAVGLGMVYMSSTETSINSNYKDTQSAFFSMRGGLEEMRDRMRSNSVPPVPALTVPLVPAAQPGAANSIVYITNPSGASDVVAPATFGNAYFDDEFCHESFAGSGVTYSAPGTPCTSAGAPPAGSVAPYVASMSPFTNTAASLKYKWARITMKQNGTFPSTPVDSTQPVASPVCWDSMGNQEVVASALGYPDCNQARGAGLNVSPTYVVTSMAITPQGSRRIGQYEVAAFSITPPPSALALDGPAATFSPAPHSANYFANGINSGASAFTGPGGPSACAATGPAQAPAISTGDQAGVTNITGSIPGNRQGNYTGGPSNSSTPMPTPAIANSGPTGSNPQLTGAWSTPSSLNALVSALANGADVTYTCGIGTPCTGTGPYGTDAAPQITYVNGDFNFGSNSGSGVLVVTGALNITGNSSFNGLILVIGQGVMNENGGGGGQFNGSIFLAKTNSSTAPYAQLAALASPAIAWNGGGTNGIQYNSCWANIGNSMHYTVVASREEMY